MGLLVDGRWTDETADARTERGRYVRAESRFRGWVTADGRPGPTGEGGFKAEAGRYHLYVSLACPWAHRTLICRALKGLEDEIGVSVVHPLMGEQGWWFGDYPGATGDPILGADTLHQIYTAAEPRYTGRVSVPVLWDRERRTVVNNESAEIIRMLNRAFDALGGGGTDHYPEDLRAEIDAVNALVYEHINNGVYRVGFARTQEAYDEAFEGLFSALDDVERRLGRRRYLAGDRITEADWRLFTTMVRFDAVYHGHFKCNRNRLVDFPALSAYTRELYQVPGVAATVDMDHIKLHYYGSHRGINPTGIVPKGPELDFTRPHGRDRR